MVICLLAATPVRSSVWNGLMILVGRSRCSSSSSRGRKLLGRAALETGAFGYWAERFLRSRPNNLLNMFTSKVDGKCFKESLVQGLHYFPSANRPRRGHGGREILVTVRARKSLMRSVTSTTVRPPRPGRPSLPGRRRFGFVFCSVEQQFEVQTN